MDDAILLNIIGGLETQRLELQALQQSTESRLDKRSLSIAITQLETAMLWIANSRPDGAF